MRAICLFIALCTAAQAHAQGGTNILFKQEKISFRPAGYFVKDVVDDRPDKSTIGVIRKGAGKEKINLQSGAAGALKGWIANNVTQNKATQPVTIHINKLDFEVRSEEGKSKVEGVINLIFYVGKDKVMEYNINGRGATGADAGQYVEGMIRKAVEDDLRKFDTFWLKNNKEVATKKDVKVNVVIGKTTTLPNCFAYTSQRPLQFADFMGALDAGKPDKAATTACGIGVAYSTQVQNGQKVLNVTVTTYFNKDESWFRPEGKKPHVLMHEQIHFDITAIKACELAASIRKATFTSDNYDYLIEQLRTKKVQEANDEQTAYDRETEHGKKKEAQQLWEKKIKVKLKSCGCY